MNTTQSGIAGIFYRGVSNNSISGSFQEDFASWPFHVYQYIFVRVERAGKLDGMARLERDRKNRKYLMCINYIGVISRFITVGKSRPSLNPLIDGIITSIGGLP